MAQENTEIEPIDWPSNLFFVEDTHVRLSLVDKINDLEKSMLEGNHSALLI